MSHARRHGTILLAFSLLLVGCLPLAPSARAASCGEHGTNWDVRGDEHGWLRVSHPTAGEVSASRVLRMHLFASDGPLHADAPEAGAWDTGDWVNGIDAYVHDFGCETRLDDPRDFCLSSIPGSTGDTDDGVPGAFDVQELPAVPARDDDWRVAFFSYNPGLGAEPRGPVLSLDREKRSAPCSAQDTVDGQVPGGTRYVVIWLDTSEVDRPVADVDASENLVPRGVQTRAIPFGTYVARFALDVCANDNPDAFDNNPCD